MITKDKLIELVEYMPDTFSVDDSVERVLILEKIEKAQKEIEKGEGMDWEDFKKEMDKW
jgi:signal recognition particle GTPase